MPGWQGGGRRTARKWSAAFVTVYLGAVRHDALGLHRCAGYGTVTGHVCGRVIRDGRLLAHDLNCPIAVGGFG